MDPFETTIRNYWNYYLELEEEVVATKKYVEFCKENNNCFSIEFLKLYQAICSEIDVLGKYVASLVNSAFKNDEKSTLYKWWIEIQDYRDLCLDINDMHRSSKTSTNLADAKVFNHLMNIEYQPWADFKLERYTDTKKKKRIRLKAGCSNPTWWTSYNKVKHHRTQIVANGGKDNYSKACLQNVCESISALYILEILVLELSKPTPDQSQRFINGSKLFQKPSLASDSDIENLFK